MKLIWYNTEDREVCLTQKGEVEEVVCVFSVFSFYPLRYTRMIKQLLPGEGSIAHTALNFISRFVFISENSHCPGFLKENPNNFD